LAAYVLSRYLRVNAEFISDNNPDEKIACLNKAIQYHEQARTLSPKEYDEVSKGLELSELYENVGYILYDQKKQVDLAIEKWFKSIALGDQNNDARLSHAIAAIWDKSKDPEKRNKAKELFRHALDCGFLYSAISLAEISEIEGDVEAALT